MRKAELLHRHQKGTLGRSGGVLGSTFRWPLPDSARKSKPVALIAFLRSFQLSFNSNNKKKLFNSFLLPFLALTRKAPAWKMCKLCCKNASGARTVGDSGRVLGAQRRSHRVEEDFSGCPFSGSGFGSKRIQSSGRIRKRRTRCSAKCSVYCYSDAAISFLQFFWIFLCNLMRNGEKLKKI